MTIDPHKYPDETVRYLARLVEITRTMREHHKDVVLTTAFTEARGVVSFVADFNFLEGYILAIDPLPVEKKEHD